MINQVAALTSQIRSIEGNQEQADEINKEFKLISVFLEMMECGA